MDKSIKVSEETLNKLKSVGATKQTMEGIIIDLIKFKESALQ